MALILKRPTTPAPSTPRRFFLELLTARLSAPDCLARGWLLDGFPHTREQAARLAATGFAPDKAIFLEGAHALLAERIRCMGGTETRLAAGACARASVTHCCLGALRAGGRVHATAGPSCTHHPAPRPQAPPHRLHDRADLPPAARARRRRGHLNLRRGRGVQRAAAAAAAGRVR